VPEPEPVPEPERPVVREEGLAAEARHLLDAGSAREAEDLLRDAVLADAPEADRADVRVLLGEILENDRRPDEAAVHFLAAAERGDGADAARAWDGLERVRTDAEDAAGAARAALHALEASPPADRRRRAETLRRDAARAPDVELAGLAALARSDAARAVLDEERTRRERAREGAPLPVTVLAPFSGKLARFGEAFHLGAEVALDERETEARAADRTVRSVGIARRDTEGDVLKAANAARHAVVEDGSSALLGPLLSVTSIAAGAVAQSYGVPMIAPLATDPELATVGPYVITLDPSPADLVRPLAQFCVDVLGERRFGVLLPSDGVTEAYEREFRAAVAELGGEVVVSVAFEPGATDFRKLLERIDRERVDALYVPGSVADLEPLASQLDFYEFDRRILGHGAWTQPRLLDPGNLALEGAVFAVEASEHPDSEFMMRLRRLLRVRTSDEPNRFHVQGYRAMTTLLEAIDRGASTGEEIAEMLRLRRHWPRPPAGDRVHVITYRDGVLGPASWATGFDLVPKTPPEADDAESPSPRAGG
jgi:branched-chain amino acid transport system substrate-binding protein